MCRHGNVVKGEGTELAGGGRWRDSLRWRRARNDPVGRRASATVSGRCNGDEVVRDVWAKPQAVPAVAHDQWWRIAARQMGASTNRFGRQRMVSRPKGHLVDRVRQATGGPCQHRGGICESAPDPGTRSALADFRGAIPGSPAALDAFHVPAG